MDCGSFRRGIALLFRFRAVKMNADQESERVRMANDTKTIYIADDDDNIRQGVRTFLASDGYQVEDFPTGDLLLERFR